MRILIFTLSILFILSCANNGQEGLQHYEAKDVAVDIEDYKPNFPETEGFNEFRASCVTCHSLRYIEMQPNFPEKTWDAIAKKMVKNFGAPIPDSTLTKVVHYLANVKGVKE